MTQNAWNAQYPSSNGQVLIGSAGTRPVAATITSGSGISITNGAGAITITALGTTSGYTQVNRQVFTGNGTYTPTADAKFIDVEVLAGGAGGASSNGASHCGGGGGAGGYARKVFDIAVIGATEAVTVGAGGAAGVNGGASSLGALISATGGTAGSSAQYVGVGGAGGAGTGGDYNITGGSGSTAAALTITFEVGSYGGSSIYGSGGAAQQSGAIDDRNGNAGIGYGAGGAGSLSPGGGSKTGGAGTGGIVIVTEYISEHGGGSSYYEEITAASKTIVVNYEYGANRGGGVAFTLPNTATTGSRFTITGIAGLWSIAQGASQYIKVGATTSQVGVGGSVTATNASDCITCTCIETNVGWATTATMGNLAIVT